MSDEIEQLKLDRFELSKTIETLRTENERLRKFGQHCGCVSSEDGESIIENCMFHAKQREEIKALMQELRADNERLRDVLRTAHRALETLGLGKTTRETAMRLIDEAMKNE